MRSVQSRLRTHRRGASAVRRNFGTTLARSGECRGLPPLAALRSARSEEKMRTNGSVIELENGTIKRQSTLSVVLHRFQRGGRPPAETRLGGGCGAWRRLKREFDASEREGVEHTFDSFYHTPSNRTFASDSALPEAKHMSETSFEHEFDSRTGESPSFV